MKRVCRRIVQTKRVSFFSTTYSGGQPSEGQGGFYGALKSRSEEVGEHQSEFCVSAEDLAGLRQLMASNSHNVAQFDSNQRQLLDRLQVNGSPVWGLSSTERKFIQQLVGQV